jgi:dTDP-4-dehydrorhamnose 3,5-epimerase
MRIARTKIEGVNVAESKPVADYRGTFTRLFSTADLAVIIGSRQIVQINRSQTTAVGAVRGLHFQCPPHAEMKLVRCLKGRVWDVAADLRTGSSTFLQWHAEELSAGNCRMLIIPEGCAHGFQVLEANSELLYLHTAPYEPTAEGGIRFSDPLLSIAWPLPVLDLSEGDKTRPLLSREFTGLSI